MVWCIATIAPDYRDILREALLCIYRQDEFFFYGPHIAAARHVQIVPAFSHLKEKGSMNTIAIALWIYRTVGGAGATHE